MGSYYYGDIFVCLANEMQWSQWEAALIEHKTSQFDNSIELIESTKVYGDLLLRRYFSMSC